MGLFGPSKKNMNQIKKLNEQYFLKLNDTAQLFAEGLFRARDMHIEMQAGRKEFTPEVVKAVEAWTNHFAEWSGELSPNVTIGDIINHFFEQDKIKINFIEFFTTQLHGAAAEFFLTQVMINKNTDWLKDNRKENVKMAAINAVNLSLLKSINELLDGEITPAHMNSRIEQFQQVCFELYDQYEHLDKVAAELSRPRIGVGFIY